MTAHRRNAARDLILTILDDRAEAIRFHELFDAVANRDIGRCGSVLNALRSMEADGTVERIKARNAAFYRRVAQ